MRVPAEAQINLVLRAGYTQPPSVLLRASRHQGLRWILTCNCLVILFFYSCWHTAGRDSAYSKAEFPSHLSSFESCWKRSNRGSVHSRTEFHNPTQALTASHLGAEPTQALTASYLGAESTQALTASHLGAEPTQALTASYVGAKSLQSTPACRSQFNVYGPSSTYHINQISQVMSSTEARRRRSSYKGTVTKARKTIDIQAKIPPLERDVEDLNGLIETISKAMKSYEATIDHSTTPDEDEAHHEQEFRQSAREAIRLATTLGNEHDGCVLKRKLEEELDEWDDMPDEELASFGTEYDRLNGLLTELRDHPGSRSPDGVQGQLGAIRTRLTRLKNRYLSTHSTSPSTSSSSIVPPADGYTEFKKARAVPLPVFDGDLSDWRSFWARFQDYISKLRHVTNNEKLTYLLECLKESEAQDIVKSSLKNREDFSKVERKLHDRFDRPRKVFMDALDSLMSMPSFDYKYTELHRTSTTMVKLAEAIFQYGDKSASQLITGILETKMSAKVREHWSLHKPSDDVPPYEELAEFLTARMKALETSTTGVPRERHPPKTHHQPQQRPPAPQRNSKPHVTNLHVSALPPCSLCQRDHLLYQCSMFREMDVPSRNSACQAARLCLNCLRPGHQARNCNSKHSCRECGNRHHTMLHRGRNNHPPTQAQVVSPAAQPQPSNSAPLRDPTPVQLPPAQSMAICAGREELKKVLLNGSSLNCTFRAIIEVNGRSQAVRGVLDTCSTTSFMTRSVANNLKAKKVAIQLPLSGLDHTELSTSRSAVWITMKSALMPSEEPITFPIALMTSITEQTPSSDLTGMNSEFLQQFALADPDYRTPGRVDILLGSDVLHEVLRDGMYRHRQSQLFVMNSMFGWVVGGHCPRPSDRAKVHLCYKISAGDALNNTMKSFWELEEAPSDVARFSPEEKEALTHFSDNVTRQPDGRYVVSLPRRTPTPTLGHSRSQAVRRYVQNRSSLTRKGKWQAFHDAVQEYSDLGHSERVPPEDLLKSEEQCFYMPMHGVIKEASSTTKLRIVFDASATTSSGLSLNSTLLPGPSLYPKLVDLLIGFRSHRIGMSSDISKMFREIALQPEEKDYHRFVVQDANGQWEDRRMTRLTFGVASSPFLATQVLLQLANDHEDDHPEAAALIRSSFYVDDCLSGADTLLEAKHLRTELNALLSKGKMLLRKWRTNSPALLKTIPEELREKEDGQLTLSPAEHHKALGVHWDSTADQLYVATPVFTDDPPPTKRRILSDISQTFDILGWWSPVIIQMKILMQHIWTLQLDWDQSVPTEVSRSWKEWRTQLHLITKTPVDRYYHCQDKDILHVQLHGFADASEAAYSGVVYIRSTYLDTTSSTSIVLAKSKVTPLKKLTIPRLELCAITLLSKLLDTVRTQLSVDLENVYAWTDSSIALQWIRTQPYRLKTFVANRVVTATDLVPSGHWRHVPTSENPADVNSRGMSAEELIHNTLWWKGPTWLVMSPSQWPSQPPPLQTTLPELRSFALTIRAEDSGEFLVERYSSYQFLISVFSWLCRFIANSRREAGGRVFSPQLSPAELLAAETRLILLHQSKAFPDEQKSLRSGLPVGKGSPLKHLKPFLDNDGVLRVGGRLEAANLSYSQKHPSILRNSALAKLIVTNMHIEHCHVGPTQLLGLLSGRHYILKARNLVREVSRTCVTCQRTYARTNTQQMGVLPPSRVKPSPPFSVTGVDFAGPILLKRGHTRKPVIDKAYISLFICLATKAVHLELVGGLSTTEFLEAFRRFVARRGYPVEMISDNGTNFVGANNDLKAMHQLLQDSKDTTLKNFSQCHQILWRFNPGRAPHFGGLWEAAVKSAKTLLRKRLQNVVLNHEEYQTILCEIEAIMNSRPLQSLSTQLEDGLEVLTPGHFLIGRPLIALPERPLHLLGANLKRWNLCRRITSEFWQRWSREYLQSLQKTSKWLNPKRNLQPGDIVLLKDSETLSRDWPLARILETIPGRDGLVRVVRIKTRKGIYTRPAHNTVLLLPSTEDQENLVNSPSSPREDVRA